MKKMNGFLLVNKPQGITSHDAVVEVRRLTGVQRVGHCGTLDPFAEGLLLVCIGEATKLSQFMMHLNKRYTGEMLLGATSDTYDRDGEIVINDPCPDIPREQIARSFRKFVGTIDQYPPLYSAIKVRGKKLYQYARKKKKIMPKSRKVKVFRLALTGYKPPFVKFEAFVGSGTYLRSIAYDVGEDLGCGAYLNALTRTQIGTFSFKNALSLGEVREKRKKIEEFLLPPVKALVHLKQIRIPENLEVEARNGHKLTLPVSATEQKNYKKGELIGVIDSKNLLLGVFEVQKLPRRPQRNVCLKPVRVFGGI